MKNNDIWKKVGLGEKEKISLILFIGNPNVKTVLMLKCKLPKNEDIDTHF